MLLGKAFSLLLTASNNSSICLSLQIYFFYTHCGTIWECFKVISLQPGIQHLYLCFCEIIRALLNVEAKSSYEKSEISIKYISDIENRISQNEEIIDKLDYLISELVSLDDPANFSLSNLNNLIRQTQDYKNINNGGIS